jgi:hypothetical protein
MESNNITNLIGSKRFKLAQNANTNIELGLEGKTKPLTEYDIIDIVNSYDLFLQERDTIKKYRFNGRFNIFVNGEVNLMMWLGVPCFLDPKKTYPKIGLCKLFIQQYLIQILILIKNFIQVV